MSSHSRTITLLLCLTWIAGLLGACGPKPVATQVSKINIEPGMIPVGETASLTVDASGTDLQFKWTASKGKISSPTAASVIYTAPDSPGPDTVTVEVTGKGGSMVKSITFQVVKPTPVTTPTATATQVPTSTPTPVASPTPPPIVPPTRTATPTGPSARITNLADGATVTQIVNLVGEYRADPTDKVWIFVLPTNNLYYQQSRDPCNGTGTPQQDGRWEMQVGVGIANDIGQPFEIVVGVANAAADKYIVDTLKAWCRANNYPGFPQLPPGVTETQRIQVTRATTNKQVWGPAPDISNAKLPGQVTLSNLKDGGSVAQTMTLKGTYSADATDDIWVLVYPYFGRWYPQSAAPCTGDHAQKNGGQWSSKAIFGNDQDKGKPFDVVVVSANAEASKFFSDKQKEFCAANNFPGFLTIQLPQGIMEQVHYRVYRP